MNDKSGKQVKDQVNAVEFHLSKEIVSEILEAIKIARDDMSKWQEASKPTVERMREPVSL